MLRQMTHAATSAAVCHLTEAELKKNLASGKKTQSKESNYLSVPERSEGTEVSKMAIREGTVFWGVWGGGSPPL